MGIVQQSALAKTINMLKTTIKASAIANLTDARYFSAWGVDWLGFCLDEQHPNYISPNTFHAMREWLAGPKIVGELGPILDIEQLHQLIEELKLDAIQVSGFTPNKEIAHLSGHIPLIREQVVETWTDLSNLTSDWKDWEDLVEFFLLDFEKNRLSWSALKAQKEILEQLQQLGKQYPIMLSIPFKAHEYEELMQNLELYGLSLKGGEEEKVGYKSFDELDELYEVLIDEY